MHIAIIADLHANLEATKAVLAEIDKRSPDRILCLGDALQHFQGAAAQRLRPGELLVDEAPREHARVMAIAPHEQAQIAQAFGRKIQLAIFVQHQQAQPVAGIQERGRRRVVRRTKGVTAHLLQ